jgi:hypothetical protein
MTDKRSAADILRYESAVAEAAYPEKYCCEECGAGMTFVEAPGDKVRGWLEHTPDCSHVDTASVFTVDAASVRNQPVPSAAEIVAISAEAAAIVEARAIPEDLLEEFATKFGALISRYRLCAYHDHGYHGATKELLDAFRPRSAYVPQTGRLGLSLAGLERADVDLLIELCDRLAIAKGKRWNAAFELRAAKERNQ